MPTRLQIAAAALVIGTVAACGGGQGNSGGASTADGGTGGAPGGTGGGVQPARVTGVALDSQGRPLAGGKISVCNPLYVSSCIVGETGSDGRYSFDLPPENVWKAYGSITKTYNGKSYCLELRPDSTSTFGSTEGAVRNFEWKLTGPKPDKASPTEFLSYYGAGAAIAVGDYNNPVPLQYVQLSFVPQGPLVDGSAGKAFGASAGAWTWNEIGDIPLGRYQVTAELAPPGSAKSALLVGTSFFQYAASATVDFEPPAGGTCIGPAEAKIYVAFP